MSKDPVEYLKHIRDECYYILFHYYMIYRLLILSRKIESRVIR